MKATTVIKGDTYIIDTIGVKDSRNYFAIYREGEYYGSYNTHNLNMVAHEVAEAFATDFDK